MTRYSSDHKERTREAIVEAAAERMSRNGIVSLGSPGSIATMVKDALDARSTTPGELVLELRGEGGEDQIAGGDPGGQRAGQLDFPSANRSPYHYGPR